MNENCNALVVYGGTAAPDEWDAKWDNIDRFEFRFTRIRIYYILY